MTKTWCVYHLIHMQTPHRHIPKLVITEVPNDKPLTTELLERAGYLFTEFGIPWANYVLEPVEAHDAPSDLVARLRQHEGERISYSDLMAKATAPL